MRALGSSMLILATLTTAAGCSWPTSAGVAAYQEPDEFPILWQKAGSYCNRKTPLRLVARTQAEMAGCPIANVPADFRREMVLAATMGRVTSDQYMIRIHRVWREGSEIKVDVRIYRPRPTTQSSIQLACPYHVVVVPRSDLNVEGFSPDLDRARKGAKRGLPLGL